MYISIIVTTIALLSVISNLILGYSHYNSSVKKGILPTMRLGLKGVKYFLKNPSNIINSWDENYHVYKFPYDRKLMIIINDISNTIVAGTIINIGTEKEHDQYIVQETDYVVVPKKNVIIIQAIVDYLGRPAGNKRTIKIEFTP